MTPIHLSREQARRFLLGYHHLTDKTALSTLSDVPGFIKRVGCIQFDPLDAAGRNADLVLQSRLPGYKKGEIDHLLYEDRILIDQWDKNMAICHVDDWPTFARTRTLSLTHRRFAAVGEARELARELLTGADYLCSADVPLNEVTDWYWNNERMGRTALEALYFSGEAVIHHKKGSRRYYAMADRCMPGHLLTAPDPHPTDASYHAHIVRRRIAGIGMLWNRGGDAWLGLMNWKSAHREEGFAALKAQGDIQEVIIDDVKHSLYILSEHIPLLESLKDTPIPGDNIRFMAPLDNMLWERILLEELFGFDYRWEVYTPVSQRKYGWYVLPILGSERFIGRIELATDKKAQTLVVRNIWWEHDLTTQKAYIKPVKDALKRFMSYNRCKHITYACKL